MDQLELQYRESGVDEDAEWRTVPLVPITTPSIRVPGLMVGSTYDFRLRVLSGTTRSPRRARLNHLVRRAVREVPAPTQVAVADGDCLGWVQPEGGQSIVGYHVHHATADTARVWDLMEPVVERPTTSPLVSLCGVPKGPRLFAVRAEDALGNVSDPSFTVLDRGALDERLATVLWAQDHAELDWPGVVEGGAVSGDELLGTAATGYGPAAGTLYGTADTDLYGASSGSPADLYGPAADPLAKLYGPDVSADYGATEYHDLVYVADVHVPDVGELGPARLSLDVGAAGAGWQAAFRRLSMPYGGADHEAYGGPDDALYCPFEQGWRPWPGRFERATPGKYQLRVIVRGGAVQPRLTGFVAALSVA